MAKTEKKELIVVGGGPGGYAAAFLAADLGVKTTLIDKEANPGGECLYRGCIPSKALLHLVQLKNEAKEAQNWGLEFEEPTVNVPNIRKWKNSVVEKLTKGLGHLSKKRKVEYIRGAAQFTGKNTLEVKEGKEKYTLEFEKAILATGSAPASVPGVEVDNKQVLDSSGALELQDVPESMLVVGGGYIGLEMGTVYHGLGAKVSLVEMMDEIMPGADRDLVKIFQKQNQELFENIQLSTKVKGVKQTKKGVKVQFENKDGETNEQVFEKVLIATGRKPRTYEMGLEQAEVELDENDFVQVNEQRQTTNPSVYAIGDVAGQPLLAHKATHEGRVAAEAIAGKATAFEPKAIPAVVYTDPEIAWCGITETEAKEQGHEVKVSKFPWSASGRAATLGRSDGLTKMVTDPVTERVLGVGIVGKGAGNMIPEAVLAVEMAALASDFSLTIHPHPTLSETLMEAAEAFYGHPTHI